MTLLEVSRHFTINVIHDGENSVRIDLSNEADMIACDADGKVLYQRSITTVVKLYDGASPVTSGISITPSSIKLAGITPSVSPVDSTGSIIVSWSFTASTTLSSASYSVIIPITYGGVTYTAMFTLTKTQSEAIYQVLPSKSVLSFAVDANNDYTPETNYIVCGYTKYTGSGMETVVSKSDTIDSKYRIWYRYIDADGTPHTSVDIVNAEGWMPYGRTVDKPLPISRNIAYIAVEFAIMAYTSSATSSRPSSTDIVDKESVPIVWSGKKGHDAAELVLTPNILLYTADEDGKATRNQSFIVSGTLLVNGTSVDVPQSGLPMSIVGSLPADVTNTGAGPSHLLFSIAKGKSPSGSFKLSATGTLNGISYTAVESVLVVANRKGSQGEVGHVGRFYYYAEEYDGTPSHYSMEQTQAPYVKVTDGATIEFWMLDNQGVEPDGGVMTASQGPKTSGQTEWTKMSSEQQYYIAKAFFGEYAQFGSFIINGDWLISSKGTINGNETSGTSGYTKFDPLLLPEGSGKIGIYSSGFSSGGSRLSDKFDLVPRVGYTIKVNVNGLSVSGATVTITLCDSSGNAIASGNRTSVGVVTLTVNASTLTRKNVYIKGQTSSGNASINSIIESSTTCFIPNFAVDGKSGTSHMNRAYIRGDVMAQGLVADDGVFVTEITPGLTTWRSVAYPLACITIGVDSDGMFLKMTDKQGNLRWNISQNGDGKITGNAQFGTIYLKKLTGTISSVDPSEYTNVKKSDCALYYTNGGYTYIEPDTSSTKIDNGYYVGVNNGQFQQNQTTGKYRIYVYHYSGGALQNDSGYYYFDM